MTLDMQSRIYLASRSPRRRELLHQIHVNFEILLFRSGLREDADINEDPVADEAVETLRRAPRTEAKARGRHAPRLWRKPAAAAGARRPTPTLELDGDIIGKPLDDRRRPSHPRRLSGRRHRVLTAVAVSDGGAPQQGCRQRGTLPRSHEPRSAATWPRASRWTRPAPTHPGPCRRSSSSEIHGSYSGSWACRCTKPRFCWTLRLPVLPDNF
jgi:predicted house-cleaning NTP pyrophosphatase (Maf/HAM1 superfamily)